MNCFKNSKQGLTPQIGPMTPQIGPNRNWLELVKSSVFVGQLSFRKLTMLRKRLLAGRVVSIEG